MEHTRAAVDRSHLDALLLDASRTFAINIPMLPGVLRDALTLGYLLLRNADTLEDAARWPKERRVEALESFRVLMLQPDEERARRFVEGLAAGDEPALPHAGLLQDTPYLLSELGKLPEAYALEVRTHVARVAQRMQSWVAGHDEDNRLHLSRLQELDDYCYSVAGIVGELITTLVALYRPALDRSRLLFLRTLETGVGAGLQLTNIIKDVFRDHLEGRYYIPPEYLALDGEGDVERMRPIVAYAYRHLCLGIDYACVLPEVEVDIRRAVLVPILLAGATLVHLLDRLEDLFRGVEVKISREQVAALLALSQQSAGHNDAIRAAWRQVTAPLASLRPGVLEAAP